MLKNIYYNNINKSKIFLNNIEAIAIKYQKEMLMINKQSCNKQKFSKIKKK